MPRCKTCGAALDVPDDPIFDDDARRIIVNKERRTFTATEWEILDVLRARESRTVSRSFLFDCVYGAIATPPDERVIEVFLCHIRKKLLDSPYQITNVFGAGFRFERVSHEGEPE